MLGRIAHFWLSGLLAAAIVWGRCPQCNPVVDPETAAHDCCKPAKPERQGTGDPKEDGGKPCPKDAAWVTHYQKSESDLARLAESASASAQIAPAPIMPGRRTATGSRPASTFSHSPPELYLLLSVFRI